jgi:hypothetical protein
MDLNEGQSMEPGSFIVTEAGTSAYHVQTARKMRSKYPNRWMMGCLRFDPMQIPEDADVIVLHWYPR